MTGPRAVRLAAVLLLAAPARAQDRPDDPPRAPRPAAPPRSASSRPGPSLPRIASRTAGFERRDGLLVLYLERARGHVWLELPAADPAGEAATLLYVESLASGLGSNPVGLDRGQLGETRLLTLRRLANRVLIEEKNPGYRALSGEPAETRAARESFATSVLWAGEVAAEDADGRTLVDFTSFLLRDAHDVAARLRAAGQGSFTLDEARSAVDLAACRSFPDNLELEAVLTYSGSEPGPEVRRTTPVPQAITLVQHHSLVRLPDGGYRPRRFDPRSGSFGQAFLDFAAPIDRPIETSYVVRFRLEKTDPGAARSPVKKPIVYYVDPGAPEPIRSALLEGARGWNAAFVAAGFEDAFRVELLPAGVDPLDVRYNVIEWVHRRTRGWAYGSTVFDPRTGEVIKGHVVLDSLRIRHDRLIFDGLAGVEASGTGAGDDPVRLALARIRQLAAHEVGHTLGLAHNFAASTHGRASVMDYPAPLIRVTAGGALDFSDAYTTGTGEWDAQAIRYAYTQSPPGTDEDRALADVVADGLRRGLVFLSDDDARPAGAANPLASLWDNGEDPLAALEQTMAVRAAALARFGVRNLRPGEPFGALEEVLAPLYFHHRYQLRAAAKLVGGLDYRYALRGDAQTAATPIDPVRQRRAIAALAALLDPRILDLPEGLLRLLAPPPFDHPDRRERFAGATAPTFDALGAAATAAEMVVKSLLQPERAARLVDFHRRNPGFPGLEDVLDALDGRAFPVPSSVPPHAREIKRVVATTVIHGMLDLAADPAATPGVRARVEARLVRIRASIVNPATADADERAHLALLHREVARYLDRPREAAPVSAPAPAPPPGDPIGTAALLDDEDCGFAAWTHSAAR